MGGDGGAWLWMGACFVGRDRDVLYVRFRVFFWFFRSSF